MGWNDIEMHESYEMRSVSLIAGNYYAQGSTASRTFIVKNADSEEEAVKYAFSNAPKYIVDPTTGQNTIPKYTASVSERSNDNIYKVQVDYVYTTVTMSTKDETEKDQEPPELNFQCSVQTSHVTQAIEQICAYSNGSKYASGDDAKTLPVGWNGKNGNDAQFEGVDIPVPETRENYTKVVRYSDITSILWRRKLASMVGRINNASFKGWEPGEVMFMGCSYQTPTRGAEKVKVTFEFLIRPNEDNASVCGHSIGKLYGHDYVWAVTSEKFSSEKVVSDVKYIFKSRLVKAADFNILGV